MVLSVPELPGFDMADALDRFGGSHAKLYKYLCLMIDDFEMRLPKVSQALDVCDGASASAQLHTLAGTASALSAVELASLCHLGEVHCKQENLLAVAHLVLQIEALLEVISRQLQPLGHNQNGGGPVW